MADDAVNRKKGKFNSRGEPKLSAQVRQPETWPTPTAKMHKQDVNDEGQYAEGIQAAGHQIALPAAVKLWPTPCASMSKGSSPASLTRKDGQDRTNDRLDHRIMAETGGQLNADWTEWLMAFPIGWTALSPLATDKYRQWWCAHGGR